MGKTTRPMEDFSEAIRLKPEYVEAWYMRGHIFARKGDHQRAVDEFTETIRLRPAYADAFHYRGISYFEQKNYPQAEKDFDKAIELNPKLGEAYYYRARTVRHSGNLSVALRDLNEALRINPKAAQWLYERGQVVSWMGEIDQAVADFTEAIRLDPKTQHYYNDRAAEYGKMSRYDLAIADLTEAIRLKPELPFFRRNRGLNYFFTGEYDKALEDLTEAIRLRPDIGEYYWQRARVHAKLGHKEPSMADLARAGELNAGNVSGRSMNYDRGVVYAEMGELEKALEEFTKSIEVNPTLSKAFFDRIMVSYRLGKRDGIRADAERYRALTGWRSEQSACLSLVCALAERQSSGEPAARTLIGEALKKCDSAAWPYPILRHFYGDLSADDLIKLATDPGKLTESHAYIGLRLLTNGDREHARPHLRWVKEHGTKSYYEYAMAIAELDRLGQK